MLVLLKRKFVLSFTECTCACTFNISIILLLFHDDVTPIRTIDKCDRSGTSQKQLDGKYQGRQEAMGREKQARAITLAGVIGIQL